MTIPNDTPVGLVPEKTPGAGLVTEIASLDNLTGALLIGCYFAVVCDKPLSLSPD